MSRKIISSQESLERVLTRLGSDEAAELRRTLLLLPSLRVANLWEDSTQAQTFWVLLLNGADNEDELRIASALSLWKQLTIKESARLACIQVSDRQAFRLACDRFDVDRCPALMMSDSPEMASFLTFDGRLLMELSAKNGTLSNFLNRLHTMVERGTSLKAIGKQLSQERFWRHARLTYQEVKSLFSINLNAG